MTRQPIYVLIIILFLLCFVESSFATSAKFKGLGDLDGGRFYSDPHGISSEGTCVVGISSSILSGGS